MTSTRLLLVLLCKFCNAFHVGQPEDFANVLAGTPWNPQDGRAPSQGNTLPLVARPWGFNHWAPQTAANPTSWWFDGAQDTFFGVRCTHQPSPWIGDYAFFILAPVIRGAGGAPKDRFKGYTSYRSFGALRPYHLDLSIGPEGIRVEMTPTDHGAIFRFQFPAWVHPADRQVCANVPQNKLTDPDEKRYKGIPGGTGWCSVSGQGIDLVSRRFSDGVPADSKDTKYAFYAHLEADGVPLPPTKHKHQDECWQHGTFYTPDMPGEHKVQAATTALLCQQLCAATGGCNHFMWWPSHGGCHLIGKGATASHTKPFEEVISGPPECPPVAAERSCCFNLGTLTNITIRVGTSFISPGQSKRALDEEVGAPRAFGDVLEESRARWRDILGRVQVEDPGEPSAETHHRLQVFYTCLYRAVLFPRMLGEHTEMGLRHWSPYNGRVEIGQAVTDNGFWDTYRTVYQLLALVYPDELGEILDGWLAAFLAGGWLPKWASPGYRGDMVGTFADVVLADGIIKGIQGFDYGVAWRAMRRDSFEEYKAGGTARGKVGLKPYIDYGYVPIDEKIAEASSRTLDFGYADAACAVAAEKLGQPADAKVLRQRSLRALASLYDSGTGLMSRKLKAGRFRSDPPEQWGGGFTEGSSFHHSFPPFNISALAALHGTTDKLLSRLRGIFVAPSTFKVGSYRREIHEMQEMRSLAMGQYAHNNQPVHHYPYLFSLLGDHNATATFVRQVMSKAYSSTGFAGDEDNGEMSAWYVLGALGLYAVAPGVTEDYVLGAVPLFPQIRLPALGLTIRAPSAAQESPLISKVLWRGEATTETTIPYSELRKGGTLLFVSPGDSAQLVSNGPGLRGAPQPLNSTATGLSSVAPQLPKEATPKSTSLAPAQSTAAAPPPPQNVRQYSSEGLSRGAAPTLNNTATGPDSLVPPLPGEKPKPTSDLPAQPTAAVPSPQRNFRPYLPAELPPPSVRTPAEIILGAASFLGVAAVAWRKCTQARGPIEHDD